MTSMFLWQQLFLGIVMPAGISGATAFFGWRFLGQRSIPLAITLGYWLGHASLQGIRQSAPQQLTVVDWLPYLLLIGLVWAGLEPLWSRLLWSRWGLRAIVVMMLAVRLLWTPLTHRLERFRWAWYESTAYLASIVLFVLLVWWLWERIHTRDSSLLASGWTLYLAALSLCILLSHSGILAQMTGVLAACLGAVMVLSWLMARYQLPAYALTVVMLPLSAIGIGAYFFADLPWYALVLLALAPASLVLLPTPPEDARGARYLASRLAIFAVPLLGTVALCYGIG